MLTMSLWMKTLTRLIMIMSLLMNEGDVPRKIDNVCVMNDNDIPVMKDEDVSVQEDPGAVNWHQEADQAGGAGHGRASGKFTWLADHHATTNDLVGRISLKGLYHEIF